ncbi:MAG: hypothetical protein KF782_11875 [Labilithrix sp.]|nr:hypothetical protein [Labilithrix sp.]
MVPVTTVFKDRLPKNVGFSVGAAALNEILRNANAAVYFVNSSTWVRQAAPLTRPKLPLLRWQRQRPRLRVGNERVRDMPEDCGLYILVYAVPSTVKHDAYAALVASASAWLPTSKDASTREGAFVEFSTSNARGSVTHVLPNWW